MEVEIRPYRPVTEEVPLRNWLMREKLTHFRAEAHITEGEAYVWIDFQYGEDRPFYCIRVDAKGPSDVGFMVETDGNGEWDTAQATDVIYEDDYEHPLTLGDLEPLARNFAEEHFWCDEEA